MAVLFLLPLASTLLGGFLAVHFRRHISLLMAIGAGLLLGAAFLDLLPEAIVLGERVGLPVAHVLEMMLLSFLIFYGLEGALDLLAKRWRSRSVKHQVIGRVAAGMLIFHSFRDGLAIGAAYAGSHPAGYAVAFGIAAHDLGDGMNTILLTSGKERPTPGAYLFLLGDAFAPLCGILLASWWSFSPGASVVLLVMAAGFFLQMATSDFLPGIRHAEGPRRLLLPFVLLGALVIYLANVLIAHYQ